MFKQSLKAGFITGISMSLLVFLIYFLWDQLGIVWPIAYVPLFATGVYALHRSGPAITGAGAATLAGGLAGLIAALLSLVAVLVVSILTGADPARYYPIWNLVPVLLDTPIAIPAATLLYDLPGLLPFPWPINRLTPEGGQISRIPLTLPLFLPVGIGLSALQAWLSYVLVRQVKLGERAVGRIAQIRASFQTKLLLGFVILSVTIFAVGWMGWASTEEMHQNAHEGIAIKHWLDHALQIETSLQTQAAAIALASSEPGEATLGEIASLSQKVTADLRHLKAIPPPPHRELGSVAASLRRKAEKSLPAVREVDSRFGDLNKAVARVIELNKSGNAAEARALLTTLGPLQQKVDAPLQELIKDSNAEQTAWMTEMNNSSHGQQWTMALLVLLVTALAFPLGYVFSQVVVQPVGEVSKGLARIGSGDFSSRVQVENQDELGELAQRVNQMSAELEGLYAELKGLNENLQQKVEEQLQEIEHARVLKRYLSPQVADSILGGTVSVDLVSSRKNLTVFFSDIRGFTALSERMEPEELIDLLNEYLTLMTDIVFKHGGTLDKYIGDAIMVFFGDPVPYQDHATRAVLMAMEMKAQLGVLQSRWFAEKDELLTIGMGVSTGYVTVGNIGSPARLDYTVIGNQVNLASRLADMAKPGQILVAERTFLAVRDLVDATEISEVTLEGVLRPVKVYEINEKATAPPNSLTVAS